MEEFDASSERDQVMGAQRETARIRRPKWFGLPQRVPDGELRRITSELFFEGDDRLPYLRRFFLLLTLATTIATLGLHLNSTAVVIAAMLVAPLMTPILGMATSITMAWPERLLRQAMITFSGAAFVVGLAYVLPALFNVPHDLTLSSEIVARTYPTGEDLLIALCAGITGSYALVQRQALAVLPGVAVAVALVPPLCAVGFLLYFRETELAGNALLLFVTNLLAIVFSGCLIFLFLGVRAGTSHLRERLSTTLSIVFTVGCLVSIAGPLLTHTGKRFREVQDRVAAADVVQQWFGDQPIVIERITVKDDLIDIFLTFEIETPTLERADDAVAKMEFGNEFRDPLAEIWSLDAALTQRLGRDVDVKVEGLLKVVRTTDIQ